MSHPGDSHEVEAYRNEERVAGELKGLDASVAEAGVTDLGELASEVGANPFLEQAAESAATAASEQKTTSSATGAAADAVSRRIGPGIEPPHLADPLVNIAGTSWADDLMVDPELLGGFPGQETLDRLKNEVNQNKEAGSDEEEEEEEGEGEEGAEEGEEQAAEEEGGGDDEAGEDAGGDEGGGDDAGGGVAIDPGPGAGPGGAAPVAGGGGAGPGGGGGGPGGGGGDFQGPTAGDQDVTPEQEEAIQEQTGRSAGAHTVAAPGPARPAVGQGDGLPRRAGRAQRRRQGWRR